MNNFEKKVQDQNIYGCVLCLQAAVMSILTSLGKIKEMRNSSISQDKQPEVDVDLTTEEPESSSPQVQLQPSHSDTNLGVLDFKAASSAVKESVSNKRERYYKYSDEERFSIGKHTAEFGAARTLRKFKGKFPNLNESTLRSMRDKYEKELKLAVLQKREPNTKLTTERRGRPLMLGPIDGLVQNYLRVSNYFLSSCRSA